MTRTIQELPRKLLDVACRIRVGETLFGDDEPVDKAAHALKAALSEIALLRKALEMAVRQNEHDMLLTGDELRICRAALRASEQEEDRADALRFRWLCAHPDWHFIERLCREFVADSNMEFLTELRRVIDARRSVELGPVEALDA